MSDIVSDGNITVVWLPSCANIAAPTLAEIAAGMVLQSTMTDDGLVNFRPETADIKNTKLDSDFNTVDVGRTNISGSMFRFYKQTGTDTIYDTLLKGLAGFTLIRRSVPSDTAFAAGQKVAVLPSKCGEVAWMDPEENTDERYEIPIKITKKPNFRAVVAA